MVRNGESYNVFYDDFGTQSTNIGSSSALLKVGTNGDTPLDNTSGKVGEPRTDVIYYPDFLDAIKLQTLLGSSPEGVWYLNVRDIGVEATSSIYMAKLYMDVTASLPPVCGDGILAGSEECDDKNLRSGDGCN